MSIESMMATVAERTAVEAGVVAECVQALVECAAVCTTCADACLAEDDAAELRIAIRLDLDCADMCATTARLAARAGSGDRDLLLDVLGTCVRFCGACRNECESHSDHDHCQICAQACQRAEEACKALIAAL